MKKIKKVMTRATLFMYGVMASPVMTITAAKKNEEDEVDVSAVTDPLNTIKVIFIAIAAGVGVIILVKNLMELSTAYQDRDSASMWSAIKGCVAGFLLASISTVIGILGF